MKKVFFLLVSFLVSVAAATVSMAHGGGLDAYGCHNNRKQGGYHCHRGPLAGKTFRSKAEMLRRLEASEGVKKKSIGKPKAVKSNSKP